MRTRPPSRAFIADNTNHNHITHINNRQSDIFSRRILINIRYSSTDFKQKLYSLLNCNTVTTEYFIETRKSPSSN